MSVYLVDIWWGLMPDEIGE